MFSQSNSPMQPSNQLQKTQSEIHNQTEESEFKQILQGSNKCLSFNSQLILQEKTIFEGIAEIYKCNDHHPLHKKVVKLNTDSFDNIPIAFISKIKLTSAHQPERFIFKVVERNTHHFYEFRENEILLEVFMRLLWCRMAVMNKFSQAQSKFKHEIEGNLMKKSQILGNWEERFIQISRKHGLKSFKDKSDGASLSISSARQIWTRFQLINNQYIAIKLWDGIFKRQFALPINNALLWAEAFFNLLILYS